MTGNGKSEYQMVRVVLPPPKDGETFQVKIGGSASVQPPPIDHLRQEGDEDVMYLLRKSGTEEHETPTFLCSAMEKPMHSEDGNTDMKGCKISFVGIVRRGGESYVWYAVARQSAIQQANGMPQGRI